VGHYTVADPRWSTRAVPMSIQRGHPDTAVNATVQGHHPSAIDAVRERHGRQDTARRLRRCDVARGVYMQRQSGGAGALVAPSRFKGQFSMWPRGSGNLGNHLRFQAAKPLYFN